MGGGAGSGAGGFAVANSSELTPYALTNGAAVPG